MFQKIKDYFKKSQTNSKKKQIEKLEKEQQARKDDTNSPSPEVDNKTYFYPEYLKTWSSQLISYPLEIIGSLVIGFIIISGLSFLINRSIDFYIGIMFVFFIATLVFGVFVICLYFVRLFQFLKGLKSGQSSFSVPGSLAFALVSIFVGMSIFMVLVSPFVFYFLGTDLITPTQKLCGTYLRPTGKKVDVAGNRSVYYKTEQRFLINNEQKDMVELKLDYTAIPINTRVCFDYKPNSKIMNNDRAE